MPITPASTIAAAYSAIPRCTVGGSQVALVDSGFTRTASGGRSLFPANRTTRRNPNTRVKVANGVTLPVKFIGCIVLCIPAGYGRNGYGDYSKRIQHLSFVMHST
eukprot:3775055-Pleurochrysis_carterae.AAC.1